jgi:hypothetical protein
MVSYADFDAFKAYVCSFNSMTREDYLTNIKHAKIVDFSPYQAEAHAKGIAFLEAFGMTTESYECTKCGQEYKLAHECRKSRASDAEGGTNTVYYWRQRTMTPCKKCRNDKVSIVKGTMLQGMATDHWLDFLDVVVMWCLEYARSTILDELHHLSHHSVDAWCEWCQQQTGRSVEDEVILKNFVNDLHPHRTQSNQSKPRGFTKKPAAVTKRPAGHFKAKKPLVKKPAMKKPAAAVLRPHHLRNKVTLQLDETLANGSRKKSRLAKSARPKKDQIWVCGAVVEDHPDMFFFRVLEHAGAAADGKPRGKDEMLKCLEAIGLDAGMVLVTDSWKGTIAAVKELKRRRGWTDDMLVHELVVHSQGQIVNPNGFSTNQIESKWSVLKRWIRKRNGGKLPGRKDRRGWKLLLQEFQWRKMLKYTRGVTSARFLPRLFFEAVATLMP